MDYPEKYIIRFWSKIDKSGDCWIWTSSLNASGYGQLVVTQDGQRTAFRSNRMAYELEFGPIPDGMLVDHICLVRACCNPKHLRLATQKQNMEHRPGANKNNVSGIRGVTFHRRRNRWQARVEHHGRKISCGYYDTKEAAGEAAAAKRIELFTHNDLDRRAA